MTRTIVGTDHLEDRVARIWEGDLLGRQYDAAVIQEFCKNRVAALIKSGRSGSFTLGVDAAYGVGKTYFLKHLFDQVSLSHPSAFIDAWTDDTIDAPWSALIVAVEDAVRKFSSRIDGELAGEIRKRAGAVLTALAKGAAKKAASYVIGDDGYEDMVDAAFEREGEKMISDFRDRKKAIADLKESLGKLVVTLGEYADAPIFIFIDELDRCRPTYAIKMLEEIKHLFDVDGVVFIIGMNKDQLTKSIAAVYGDKFDARDYLRRFVEKFYNLSSPSSHKLIRYYLERGGYSPEDFHAPPLRIRRDDDLNISYIAECANYWDCAPRNIIRVVDALLTAASVWNEACKIILPLLVPMIIREVLGEDEKFINEGRSKETNNVDLQVSRTNNDFNVHSLYNYFREQRDKTYYQLMHPNASFTTPSDVYLADIFRQEFGARDVNQAEKKTTLALYDKLVSAIARID